MSAAAARILALSPPCNSPSASSAEASMLELERYELFEGPAYKFDLERRDFFKLLGGGLVLLLAFDDLAEAQESGRARGPGGESLPQNIGAWLHIGEDGAVTVYTGKAEMGQ